MEQEAVDALDRAGATILELAQQFQTVVEMLGDELDDPKMRALAQRMKLRNEQWAADPGGRGASA